MILIMIMMDYSVFRRMCLHWRFRLLTSSFIRKLFPRFNEEIRCLIRGMWSLLVGIPIIRFTNMISLDGLRVNPGLLC